MQYIVKQAKENERHVKQILTTSGYNLTLDKYRTIEHFITQCKTQAQQLPRYILSNNTKYLNFFFNLLRNCFV